MLEIGSSPLFKFALVAGISQGLFFLVALRKVKNKAPLASKLLMAIFAILILSIAGRFAYDLEVHQLYPHLFLFVDLCLFLFGPFYYFYAKSVLYPNFKIGRHERLHFLPAIVHLISLGIQFAIKGPRFYELVEQRNALLYNIWYVFEGLSILSIVFYLVLTLRTLTVFKRLDDRLPLDNFKISYFRIITSLMLLSMTIWTVSYGNLLFVGKRLVWAFDLTWLPMVMINFIIGYYMIIKPEFFKVDKSRVLRISSPETQNKLNKLSEELQFLLKTEKPYLNPELSVNDLATMMTIKPHLVTKVLTQSLKTNFFELINAYRVDEFVTLVSKSNGQKTYLAMAYDVGFNSKTTFNKAFKKEKGLSPRAYFKLNQSA